MYALARQVYWALLSLLPTGIAAAVTFRLKLGRWPRRHEPMSFNDRLHAGKLHWRDPLMTRLVDKVQVKDIVAGILGSEWVTPTLYAGPTLPPRAERNWPYPYVIKTNHSSGTNYFVRSEADEDWPKIEGLFARWLARRHNPKAGEWQYLNVVPKILVEPMILADGSLPVDFKIYTFSGKAVFVQVFPDRKAAKNNVFFDRAWNRKNFCRGFNISALEVARPASLELMFDAAERLSLGVPFVRMDFYEIDGQPRFGEVTFFPSGGYARFTPSEKDAELGEIWRVEEMRARGHALADYKNIAL